MERLLASWIRITFVDGLARTGPILVKTADIEIMAGIMHYCLSYSFRKCQNLITAVFYTKDTCPGLDTADG